MKEYAKQKGISTDKAYFELDSQMKKNTKERLICQ